MVGGWKLSYEAVNVLLDENVTTIGLISTGEFLMPLICEAHPWVTDLPELVINEDDRNKSVTDWVDSISEKVGHTHETPIYADQWEKRSLVDDLNDFTDRLSKDD